MASIHKRETAAGDRWLVRWREPDGTERTESKKTLGEARKRRAEVEGSITGGTYVSPAGGRETFERVAAIWWDTRRVADSTRDRDRIYLDRYVLPTFGGVRVGKLQPADVERWVAGLHDRGLSPATWSRALRYVRAILDLAVRDRLIPTNPAAKGLVRLPATSTPRPRDSMTVLTAAQVVALVEAVEPYYRPLVATAAATGMRWGELAGLPVEAVDFLGGTIEVRQQLTEVNGRLKVSDSVKTASARRSVTVGRPVLDVIAGHVGAFPNEDGLVFVGPEGGWLRRSNFARRVLRPACEAIGVEGFTFHDLRHTHASLLLADGHPVTEVAARLGHAHPGITLQTYAHAIPGNERAAADAIDGLLAGALEAAPLRSRGTRVVRDSPGVVVPISR